MVIQEVWVHIPLPITFSKVVVPPIIEQFNNYQEQQMNDFITHNNDIIDEPTIDEPQEIVLRKSQRQRKFAMSNNYVVYLQESKFGLGIDNDPVSFSQAISNDNSD